MDVERMEAEELTFAPSIHHVLHRLHIPRQRLTISFKLAEPTPTCVRLWSRLPMPSGFTWNTKEAAFCSRVWLRSKLLIPSGISALEPSKDNCHNVIVGEAGQ